MDFVFVISSFSIKRLNFVLFRLKHCGTNKQVARILDDIPTPTELQQRRLSPKVQTFDVNAGDECGKHLNS